jgi:hypothetical protein
MVDKPETLVTLDITQDEDKPETLVTLDIAQDEDKKPKQTNTVRKATKMSNTDTTKNTRGLGIIASNAS